MKYSFEDRVMPLKGLYVAVASLICALAMAADVFQGFRQRKLWFPCRFFTINAASTALITVTMKLLVDLTTELPGENDQIAKSVSILFLYTMLANFLPSLGDMDDKELFINIIALGILIITVLEKLCIQEAEYRDLQAVVEMSIFIFFLPWPFWVALTVPTFRRSLEYQYHQKSHRLLLGHQEIRFSSKELTNHVKKYWMMAETGNPQFVLACSPFCYASGLLCSIFATISLIFLIGIILVDRSHFWYGESDYKWSINLILTMQLIGIVVGSIAPTFRCITIIGYFNPKEWSINQINMFRVEKLWTQRLWQWKHIHFTSHIPGRHCKKVFNHVKNMILNICMALQITVLVICKTICFVPTCIMLLYYYFGHFCNLLLKRLKKDSAASDNKMGSEVEEYNDYVLKIEEEAKLSDRTLRNMLRSITKLLHKSEKKQPINLMKFLDKSRGFSGVVELGVSPLHNEETRICWSLVAVTLTAIALALPNIGKDRVKGLLASMREGLKFVTHIEETLDANDDLVEPRKTARRIWIEAEVYCKWLETGLQKQPGTEKSSKESLGRLREKAEKIVKKRSKKTTIYDSRHMFIAADAMYKICNTILLHFGEQESWPTDAEVFDRISTIIADLLWACFTNLPRVITLKCHHSSIKKRRESIRTAARLLGESKTILNILEERQLPDLDQESMAYIENWLALPKSRIPNASSSSELLLDV